MIIDAQKHFGMELNDEDIVRDLATKFPPIEKGPLEIDFSGCIIDYEAGSLLMDAAIAALRKANPPRDLTARFNIAFPDRLFLKWLFFGSEQLGLKSGAASDDNIASIVDAGFKRFGLKLHICVVDSNSGSSARRVTYG